MEEGGGNCESFSMVPNVPCSVTTQGFMEMIMSSALSQLREMIMAPCSVTTQGNYNVPCFVTAQGKRVMIMSSVLSQLREKE